MRSWTPSDEQRRDFTDTHDQRKIRPPRPARLLARHCVVRAAGAGSRPALEDGLAAGAHCPPAVAFSEPPSVDREGATTMTGLNPEGVFGRTSPSYLKEE